MRSIVVFILGATVVLLALSSTWGQGTVEYGQPCNGLLAQCNRYSETVLCMSRKNNASAGIADQCATGLGVDIGRCQCRRNCPVNGQNYTVDGEFDVERQKCVGFVGKSCQLFPDCTGNSTCDSVSRICKCDSGFVPTTDGLRCTPMLIL